MRRESASPSREKRRRTEGSGKGEIEKGAGRGSPPGKERAAAGLSLFRPLPEIQT